jgi:hypothetical protein
VLREAAKPAIDSFKVVRVFRKGKVLCKDADSV